MKQRRLKPGEAAGAAPAKPAAPAAIDAADVDARASGKAAAACDDGLDGLDLRRHWFTQCFRDANVGYHYRRRHHRSFTPVLVILLLMSWAHDTFLLDFSAVDTSDVPLVVAAALQLLPILTTSFVLVVWSRGTYVRTRISFLSRIWMRRRFGPRESVPESARGAAALGKDMQGASNLVPFFGAFTALAY